MSGFVLQKQRSVQGPKSCMRMRMRMRMRCRGRSGRNPSIGGRTREPELPVEERCAHANV
eukprot:jgi/Psemu1/300169/fgenesh1_kg.7_\